MEGDSWIWSWERRGTHEYIDKAKRLSNVDEDAGEDWEMMAIETGFTTAM